MAEKRSILICDDDAMITQIVVSKLSNLGYQVLTASNGIEALRTIEMSSPSLLILDAIMPGLSGFDVLRTVRGSPQYPPIRILMLTSRRREDDVARAIEFGADDYLTKPFSLGNLMMRVERLLTPRADANETWI